MIDFPAMLRALAAAGVEYIVVGGAAAAAHGSVRLTLDLDVVYQRTPDNLARVVNTLAAHHPYLRGAPPGLPFRWDVETIRHGLNFTLVTDLGWIDFLGEIVGGGGYDALLPHTDTLEVRHRVPLPHTRTPHSRQASRGPRQGSRGDRGARGLRRRTPPLTANLVHGILVIS
jgi:hypothetical protein